MSGAIGVAAMLGMVWLLSGYHRESVESPGVQLPFQSTPDVRRWRHDGEQPTAQRRGNLYPAVPWPEVETAMLMQH